MNAFTERMSAVAYTGTTSIHPNGRHIHKKYPAAKANGRLKKAMARLNARRLDHSATVAKDSAKAEAYHMPGSMKS